MKTSILLLSLLSVIQINTMFAQDAEVIKTAKEFCHSTNGFFYFKDDETFKSKSDIPLSKIFDYKEATYFVSAGVKTVMILPKTDIANCLESGTKYFEKTGEYTYAVRGQSRTMMKDGKATYRFYPYRNAVVFEIF